MSEVKQMYEEYPFPDLKLDRHTQLYPLIKPIMQALNIEKEDLKDKIVLDLGCGTGEKTIAFAYYCRKATGIDFCKESLRKARKQAEKLHIINVEFRKGDVQWNIEKLEQYDIVISSGVLHHLKNPYCGFCACQFHAKKGGLMAIEVYNKYGRVLSNIKRKLVNMRKLKESQTIEIAKRLYGTNNEAIAADYLMNPRETSYSVDTIIRWFKAWEIKIIGIYRPVSILDYMAIAKSKIQGKEHKPTQKPRTGNKLTRLLVQLLYWLPRERTLFIVGGKR